jgi:hypothetical protein
VFNDNLFLLGGLVYRKGGDCMVKNLDHKALFGNFIIDFYREKNKYPILVDNRLSMEQILVLGHYDWINPDIFLLSRLEKKDSECNKEYSQKEIVVELYNFGHSISTQDALKRFKEIGFRPVNLRELLILGGNYPQLQCECFVAALGTFVTCKEGCICVPYLFGISNTKLKRYINLHYKDNIWKKDCWFAVVRCKFF